MRNHAKRNECGLPLTGYMMRMEGISLRWQAKHETSGNPHKSGAEDWLVGYVHIEILPYYVRHTLTIFLNSSHIEVEFNKRNLQVSINIIGISLAPKA